MSVPALSSADYTAYKRALRSSTSEQWHVDVLTLDHKARGSVTSMALSGSVTFNAGADVDRTLQATFLDPNHQLHLDSDDPSEGAVGFNRLIRFRHSLWTPGLTGGDNWVTVPVFTGIPVQPERDGDTITVTASDKAIRSLAPREIKPYSIRKGHQLVSAIRTGLGRCGETKFRFPVDTTTRVVKHTAVGGSDENKAPWKVFRRLARAGGYQLFYDRNGYATLRRKPASPVLTWRTDLDTAATVTQAIKIRTDFTTLRNRVRVKGKKGVSGRADLPSSHPFSAHALAAGGEPCHLTLWYENSNIGSDKEAEKVAARLLAENQVEAVDVSFSCVPVYHLDPQDCGRFITPDSEWRFRIADATVPIGASGDMSIGHQTRVRRPDARAIRHAT